MCGLLRLTSDLSLQKRILRVNIAWFINDKRSITVYYQVAYLSVMMEKTLNRHWKVQIFTSF